MSKREVWIICFIVAVIGIGSVAYRLTLVTHFDSSTWRQADEPSEFLTRRAMMPEVEQMFVQGKFNSADSADKLLGKPERTADDNPDIWYYNLGGQESSSAPETITWLEITFDSTGRLESHRTTQELIVPDPAANPPK